MPRRINYRRIVFLNQDDDPQSLTELLSGCLEKRPTVDATEFELGTEKCRVKRRILGGREVRLHIATHIEGALKSTSPRAIGLPEADLGSAPPPPETEFTEREVVMSVRDEALAYVAKGRVQPNLVERAVAGLLRLEYGSELANRFFLTAQADQARVRELVADGVDYLDLGLELPHLTAEVALGNPSPSLAKRFGDAILSELSARFQEDFNDDEIQAISQARSELRINVGRRGGQEQVSALTKIAGAVVEAGDEFTVRTVSGDKVTHDTLVVSRTYNENGAGPNLNYFEAWREASRLLDDIG